MLVTSPFVYYHVKITNMSKWNADSGILRKKQTKDKHEDLLVFGYACKLFRDDEKALYIDQGKHLIPWMGDEKLKIDRYDGRGALSELASCEASREGYDAMRWLGLSDSERRIEQLCDEERYYSLKNNEEEEALYKEEELKRLQQKSNEFQYNYDNPSDKQNVEESATVERQEDVEPFVPPPELDVPVDIPIPKTLKENHRIEKTADFVCRQGPQMEILIKAKQGDNPQFGFMNQDNPLYKYYRHVLSAIKDGRYKVKIANETENKQEVSEQEAMEEHYLHPSLLTATTQPAPLQQEQQQRPPAPPLPAIPYKPSADCAYSQLVNRIQGGNAAASAVDAQTSHQQMSYEQQQQYYQYYYASQYYEYYKQMSQYQTQGEGAPDFNLYNQYLQQVSNNPYAQIVSNLNKDATVENNVPKNPIAQTQKEPETTINKPLFSLADYGSGSDEDDDTTTGGSCIKIPPGDIKIIIDKMAAYVAKNGADFEKIVRSKGDPRFNFLDEKHDYHAYYESKIREHSHSSGKEQTKSVKDEASDKDQNGIATKTKEKKPIAPVSFSIKKPKEDPPKEIRSALPTEESDEDAPNAPETTPVTVPEKKQETDDTNKESIDPDDPILEMIDLTDDNEEKRDAKRAEDRIKDKLAAAAREKLASVSRDRALQLERRKKALAFVKMKVTNTKDDEKSKTTDSNSDTTETKGETHVQVLEDTESDEGEIKSRKSSKHRHKHKRKHSKSKHESRSHRKSKKKRRRSDSHSDPETSHVS